MNVLLVRAGALGDILLLRRALALLQDAGHQVGLLAPGHAAAALAGTGPGRVASIIPWDRADVAWLLADSGPPPNLLREQLAHFDLAIAYTRNPTLVQALGQIVPRVLAQPPLPGPGEHASMWACRPLLALFGPARGEPPVLAATPDERAGAAPLLAQLPEGFLAIHPGSGSPTKNWPAARFAALVAPAQSFLLVEGPADAAACAPLHDLPGAVPAHELAPGVLGATLARAGVYVGNDSGVTHLAAAWGAAVVALFGPTDPAIWGPVGPHVVVVEAPGRQLTELSIERVRQAIERAGATRCGPLA